jgi:hypothetical protein
MTEAEWVGCTNTTPMLEFLRGKSSERKLRLFAVGCCRKILPLLTGCPSLLLDHERRAVAVGEQFLAIAEQYADGLLQREPIDNAYRDVLWLLSRRVPEREPWAFALVAILRVTSTGSCHYGQIWEYGQYDASQCAGDVVNYVSRVAAWASRTDEDFEATHFRCIFGNPFRNITIDPDWLTLTVLALAQAAYDNRILPVGMLDNDRLAVLADALEDVFCTDQTILGHLRDPGPHYRGCHVLDLLLGKE